LKASDCHGYGMVGVDWPRSKIDPVINLECCQHQVSIEQNCTPTPPYFTYKFGWYNVPRGQDYNLKGKLPVSRSLSVAVAIDRHIPRRGRGIRPEVSEWVRYQKFGNGTVKQNEDRSMHGTHVPGAALRTLRAAGARPCGGCYLGLVCG
jgi:hypothetical protein